MASSADNGRSEAAKQVLMSFDEIKHGVEQLQKCVNELASGLPELSASLREITKAVAVLGEATE